ncbi:MAG: DUF349 domain-containing protein [Bacteroidales bacterium]|nr:DUF349 domain-containing protein [Bacteroidales bacterium]
MIQASDVEQKEEQTVVAPVAETVKEETAPAEPAETPAQEPAEAPAQEPAEAPAEPEAPAAEPAEEPKSLVDEAVEKVQNYSEKTLAELTGIFEGLMEDADRLRKSKEAEAIKSAFYKKLSKEKADAGLAPEVDEDAPEAEADAEQSGNPFVVIENGFKALYNRFRKERAEYNRKQEQERAENLVAKKAVIEDLKALVDKQEDVSSAFPEFRAIQARWREIGPVPATDFRNINDTYQFYVEQFYDKVQLNRDMRDLDFKKNLEVKEKFCEEAESLAENENVVDAFKELQKLHEQWKEYGPVAKEFRDSIWDRFKAATAVINKKYQAYFEDQKSKFAENLEAKTRLCEQVEEIAATEPIKTSGQWNELSKKIEEIQKEWRTIGFASRKENQKIYDRFRAACDKFFERKRVYYNEFKDNMNSNMDRKLDLIRKAEELKASTEWKKTTEQFIELQKQWKEIGAVPRKKSEQLWQRFRAACDEFFAQRDKQAKPENDFYGNLKAKKALVEEIKAYDGSDEAAAADFAAKWQAIGFVPFKEKDAITQAYRDAMKEKFPSFGEGRRSSRPAERTRGGRGPLSEKDKLVQQYNTLQQEIDTYENNIGFFAASKNSAALISQMQDKIAAAKDELKALEEKIRAIENSQEE